MFVQYDDVTVSLIPGGAQAVLGYTDGEYDNRDSMRAAFPKALQTFLTVTGLDFSADGVDSEVGDASNAAVIGFCHAKLAQGKKPVVYTFLSNMRAMLDAIYAAGIPREKLIILSAHVTEQPHICGPQCGFELRETVDATQWTFTALGRSLDESLCAPSYFERSLVPPAPVDPHHYLWFDDVARRARVKEYDYLRTHRIKNHKQLVILRAKLQHDANEVAAHVIREAPHAGTPARKAAWNKDHRGWRYRQLIRRANGKRVVK
jgi:hypothetical protein